MNKYLLIIPTLGMLKNLVKYKRISLYLFFRTPLIYFFLYNYLNYFNYKNKISLTIINERIIMFIYKIIISLLNNNFYKKKDKYKIKYNIKYNQ